MFVADPEFEEARPSSLGEEEMQLQIALALSREECEKEQELRRGDDIRLQVKKVLNFRMPNLLCHRLQLRRVKRRPAVPQVWVHRMVVHWTPRKSQALPNHK
jgi:hypothetical protein